MLVARTEALLKDTRSPRGVQKLPRYRQDLKEKLGNVQVATLQASYAV